MRKEIAILATCGPRPVLWPKPRRVLWPHKPPSPPQPLSVAVQPALHRGVYHYCNELNPRRLAKSALSG
jgi:hypothetical protein